MIKNETAPVKNGVSESPSNNISKKIQRELLKRHGKHRNKNTTPTNEGARPAEYKLSVKGIITKKMKPDDL